MKAFENSNETNHRHCRKQITQEMKTNLREKGKIGGEM
jgi:hypothetical protein